MSSIAAPLCPAPTTLQSTAWLSERGPRLYVDSALEHQHELPLLGSGSSHLNTPTMLTLGVNAHPGQRDCTAQPKPVRGAQHSLSKADLGIDIYLGVRGRAGPFSLNYSMGTLTKDPDTPAPASYNFLLLYPGRSGMRGGCCGRKGGRQTDRGGIFPWEEM